MLDASEAKRFKSLAATLNNMSSDWSDVQYFREGSKEEAEEGMQVFERLRKSDVCD